MSSAVEGISQQEAMLMNRKNGNMPLFREDTASHSDQFAEQRLDNESWSTLEQHVRMIWQLFEKIRDSAYRQRHESSKLEIGDALSFGTVLKGWHFVDLMEADSGTRLQKVKLTASPRGWIAMTREVDCINLFAENFGELIVSEPRHPLPEWCRRFRDHRDMLVASVRILTTLAEHSATSHPETWNTESAFASQSTTIPNCVQLAAGFFWTNVGPSFKECDCPPQRRRPHSCHHMGVKMVPWRSVGSKHKASLAYTIPKSLRNGAVIFFDEHLGATVESTIQRRLKISSAHRIQDKVANQDSTLPDLTAGTVTGVEHITDDSIDDFQAQMLGTSPARQIGHIVSTAATQDDEFIPRTNQGSVEIHEHLETQRIHSPGQDQMLSADQFWFSRSNRMT